MSNKVKAKTPESAGKRSISILLNPNTLKKVDEEGEKHKRKRATQIAYIVERWEQSIKAGEPFC